MLSVSPLFLSSTSELYRLRPAPYAYSPDEIRLKMMLTLLSSMLVPSSVQTAPPLAVPSLLSLSTKLLENSVLDTATVEFSRKSAPPFASFLFVCRRLASFLCMAAFCSSLASSSFTTLLIANIAPPRAMLAPIALLLTMSEDCSSTVPPRAHTAPPRDIDMN